MYHVVHPLSFDSFSLRSSRARSSTRASRIFIFVGQQRVVCSTVTEIVRECDDCHSAAPRHSSIMSADIDNDDDDEISRLLRVRVFRAWSTVTANRRATDAQLSSILRHWRELARTESRERRELIDVVRALRVEVLQHVFNGWRRSARWEKTVRVALKAHRERWNWRLLARAFRAWFAVARDAERHRVRERDKTTERERLEMKLDLMRARAERDAAVEKAKMSEKVYKALEFREAKTRSQRDADADFIDEAIRLARTNAAEEALTRANRQRAALVRILRELRAQAVQDLDYIDFREREARFRSDGGSASRFLAS